ncbi:hypothetical protein PV04_09125 [Phialophora macrospora]|uniref:Uncharacterized protein n=1 Tax=Phialophora macrospora TaxID=1851006 RepID=A0A0D2DPK7_9EURO|nr:hypothetical protein PV04_09125 [Phialophora macrospora]
MSWSSIIITLTLETTSATTDSTSCRCCTSVRNTKCSIICPSWSAILVRHLCQSRAEFWSLGSYRLDQGFIEIMSSSVRRRRSLSPSSGQFQSRPQYPNFSRPRCGHQWSYSAELPSGHTKADPEKSQHGEDGQTTKVSYDAEHATIDTVSGQGYRVLETLDDGMINRSRQRNFAQERHCTEQDVRDAFERWVLTDKARRRRKQPYFAHEGPDPMHFSHVQNEHVHGDAQEEEPVYEKVDGVVMDTCPGSSAGPYAMEQTLPEIEAHDICKIQDRSTNKSAGEPADEDARATPSSSLTDSTSRGSGASPQLWSECSGSSSTASTDNGVPKPYRHLSKEFKPSAMDDREVRQQITASRSSFAPSISELVGQLPLAELRSANTATAHTVPVEVIDKEERRKIANSQFSNAAPALNVKQVRDGELLDPQSRPPAAIKKESVAPMDSTPQDVTSHDHLILRHRKLGAAGTGGDGLVYELEAVGPVKPSINSTSLFVTYDDNDGPIDGPNAFAKLEQAVHLKVEKNVTFSPVDDVRFMTPSPHRLSMDTTSAVEVDLK